jgi:hypothetical protein
MRSCLMVLLAALILALLSEPAAWAEEAPDALMIGPIGGLLTCATKSAHA